MTNKIDGEGFKRMVDCAVRNLNRHVMHVNQLNVFPVPDGDTGTNMVTTIHKGLLSVGESIVDLPEVAKHFARSVVFEARGNSGVIVSQFLKGIAEKLSEVDTADGALFIKALEQGVKYAYASVANPVEGTMLTVMRDATDAVKFEFDGTQSVKDIVDSFVCYAKKSLDRTPELLSVLKEQGVVDSGGAGVVYLFEGMQKYLNGEEIETSMVKDSHEAQGETCYDYDSFHEKSRFPYGYCTELLIQRLEEKEPFSSEGFREDLGALGESLVVSEEAGKVRVHIHTRAPEKVLHFCRKYGEFLSVKIENMTVQNRSRIQRILASKVNNDGAFAVVAVAADSAMQRLFLEMGADVAICAEENVSIKDYLDAFEKSGKENIIVFPNGSDAILSAMQAKKMFSGGKVTVIPSRSVAECYAALPTVDFEEKDTEKAADAIIAVLGGLVVASIARRKNSICYRDREIRRNEYYSFSGKELILVSRSLGETAVRTMKKVVTTQGKEIVTVFYQPAIPAERIEKMIEAAKKNGVEAEFFSVPTESLPCLMTLSFE